MKVFSGLDEFVAAQGSELGPTEWMEVTQDRVNLFADLYENEFAAITFDGLVEIKQRANGRRVDRFDFFEVENHCRRVRFDAARHGRFEFGNFVHFKFICQHFDDDRIGSLFGFDHTHLDDSYP